MKVAIFGAGLAGLSAAIALRAQGHDCDIYERSRSAHDAGMGFILLPEAVSCLESLGVKLEGECSGIALTHYICRDSSGKTLRRQALPQGTRSFRRRDLIAGLVATLKPQEEIIFDAEFQQIDFNDQGSIQDARLSSGARIQADLYIAADGSRSVARASMFPGWAGRSAQVAEIVGMLRCNDVVNWAAHDFNKFHAPEGGLALGTVPVDADHVVWFTQFDVQRFGLPEDSPEKRLAFVKNLVGGWGDPVPHLLEHTDHSRVYLWRPVDSDLVPQFYRGNLVLVGDAAHPMLPFTSRGVSSAIEDIVALSNELHHEPDLQRALAAYSRQRREQCLPYISKGRELTRIFLAPLQRKNPVVPIAL